jgi:hypothetical protein
MAGGGCERVQVADDGTVAGLAVKHTPQLGRALYAERPFAQWEVVLVEAPCMVAGCAVQITDDAPPEELFAAWRNQARFPLDEPAYHRKGHSTPSTYRAKG